MGSKVGIISSPRQTRLRMRQQNRLYHIDFLRAIATILIVVTHVFQYHLNNPVNTFIWNYSHFAVVLFVFCSVTVLLPSYERMDHTASTILAWYKKRIIRLLKPFYVYVLAHSLLILMLPMIFTGNGLLLTPRFLFDSITLMNGINFNWLVLLFIEITLIFPVLYQISTNRVWTMLWAIGSFLFILATHFLPTLHTYYRLLMIIGWSLVVLISILVVRKKLTPFQVFLTSGVIFLSSSWGAARLQDLVQLDSGVLSLDKLGIVPRMTFNLISHKYPPDVYYLSYATMMSMVMYYISKARIWDNAPLKRGYTFISQHSYEIFFIHYIVLDASLRLQMNVWLHFLTVFSMTLTVVYCLYHILPLILSPKLNHPTAPSP